MPKEHRKRGRRGDKKRKRSDEEGQSVLAAPSKRHKTEEIEKDDVEIILDGNDSVEVAQHENYVPFSDDGPGEMQFYGMLDEQEQEYFKQADVTLDLNQFADPEERTLFLNNIWKEAKGKELKIANSQSCSRLMERLIAASTPQQLKVLWGQFETHFLNLFQHRFASHCCEALFQKAAPIVSLELSASTGNEKEFGLNGEELPSMEDLFLSCTRELEGNLGYLITDQFASHPLRVLLIVLSGMSLEDRSTTSVLQSKKKEHNVSTKRIPTTDGISMNGVRPVPTSFRNAVEHVISGATSQLDTTTLRSLATHPVANPVLQIMLALSFAHSSKTDVLNDPRSLFRLLLPEDSIEEGTESAVFINHLLYDPIGSRLLETVVVNAPGKTFKILFRSIFRDRLGSMARNETAGFVVVKILERLGQADLQNAVGPICRELGSLVQRSRTAVVKTLIERCRIRDLDEGPIVDALRTTYGEEAAGRLPQMLKLAEMMAAIADSNMSAERKKQLDTSDTNRLDGSLLAQSMLAAPGPLRDLVTTSILAMEMPALNAIAEDRTASRVLQAALIATDPDIRFKRQFMPLFYPHVAKMACHPVASHVVDVLWEASMSLRFVREHIADELLKEEASMRASVAGRAVWRNWCMDTYKTRRREWYNLGVGEKGLNNGDKSTGAAEKPKKTGIELARERHAALKQVHKQTRVGGRPKWSGGGGRASGANAVEVK